MFVKPVVILPQKPFKVQLFTIVSLFKGIFCSPQKDFESIS